MAQPFPYTYYSCPCIDTSAPSANLPSTRKPSQQQPPPDNEEERTFDPRSPRANYSLFPLEHLLYCTECHQIRCTRCMVEEVVCWYCPTCLFEVPSSTVRSEGNRCTRNCYNCPMCSSPLTVNPLEAPSDEPKSDAANGPFIFVCGYCNWTSLDIGIKFEKHTNITAQLSRIKNGGKIVAPKERGTQGDRLLRREVSPETGPEPHEGEEKDVTAETPAGPPDAEELFSNLNAFYRNQIIENAESAPLGSYGASSDLAFSSPSSITRLLNLYSGKKTKRPKPRPMREALGVNEGLKIFDPASEDIAIEKLHTGGWETTTSLKQRELQEKHAPRFIDELRPVASLLRTKRAKRCKTCRTLLARPEPKVSSTRYRIKVLALNNIPKVGLRSLTAPVSIGPYLGTPLPVGQQGFDYDAMVQLQTYQFLLTLANPLFDPIRVTLATPAETPGRVKTGVTILCPEFSVNANSDVWDEALNAGGSGKRRSVMPGAGSAGGGDEDTQKQAEAGKIWGKGRNWTSVIVEIVPGMLPAPDDIEEDEDLLEIPVFVRIEYETEAGGEEKAVSGAAVKETREEAFWCVLGVGRIKY